MKVVPSLLYISGLPSKTAGSLHSALKKRKQMRSSYALTLLGTIVQLPNYANFNWFYLIYSRSLTNGIHGVFDISRHLFLDDLLNILVGASDELLKHCEQSCAACAVSVFHCTARGTLLPTESVLRSGYCLTSPQVRETPGAQHTHEAGFHGTGVIVACITKFLCNTYSQVELFSTLNFHDEKKLREVEHVLTSPGLCGNTY